MAKVKVTHDDPEYGILANAFGIDVAPSAKYGFITKGALDPGEGGQFGPQIFTPGTVEDISEYIKTPLGIGDVGQWGREQFTPEMLAAVFSQHQEVGGNLLSSLNEGLSTGWEVDVQPLIDQALGEYYNEYVPQTAETFSGSTGVSSSAFGQALTTGAQELATNIGAYKYNAQEAAAARQAAITPMAGDISANYLAGNLAFGSDVAAYDRYLAELERSSTPGATQYDAFMKMAGLDSSGTTVVQPEGPSTGALIASGVAQQVSG
jgi:hypothetical protein